MKPYDIVLIAVIFLFVDYMLWKLLMNMLFFYSSISLHLIPVPCTSCLRLTASLASSTIGLGWVWPGATAG